MPKLLQEFISRIAEEEPFRNGLTPPEDSKEIQAIYPLKILSHTHTKKNKQKKKTKQKNKKKILSHLKNPQPMF